MIIFRLITPYMAVLTLIGVAHYGGLSPELGCCAAIARSESKK